MTTYTLEQLSQNIDSLWIGVAAILVFWMQAGFAMLESGSVRSKNSQNILFKNFIDVCITTILWWLFGYGMAYGTGDFIGTDKFNTYGYTSTDYRDWLFQWAFAGTTMTIVSGCMAERTTIHGYMILTVIMNLLIYPWIVHWTWGGDWLFEGGFTDFAGSGIVHLTGGISGLVATLVLGKRIGRFEDNVNQNKFRPHNMPQIALGTFILWLGWFGFNGGSQLAMATKNDINAISAVFANTNIAAAAGAMTAAVFTQLFYKKVDLTMVLNGALAGLVSITAGPDYPTMGLAIIIGMIGSGLAVIAIPLFDKVKIDDPVGALSVHLVAGVWGTLAVCIFKPEVSLLTQLWGVGIIGAFVFAASFAVWYGIKLIVGLRVSAEEEMRGIDIVEFGHPAYTIGRGEFVTHEEIKNVKGFSIPKTATT